ncbi:MAG: hypothetical protein AABZ11_10750, partial [Nitrospinota bacterium]
KVFCSDMERTISKKECFPDQNSRACEICPHKVKVSKDKYRKKPYTPPKNKVPWSDSHYQTMAYYDKRIKELKNKNHTDKKSLKYCELMLELGRKNFDLDTYSSLLPFDLEDKIRLVKEVKIFEQERRKREREYKKIIKILEKYRYMVILKTPNGDLGSFENPLYTNIERDSYKLIVGRLQEQELSIRGYLSQKNFAIGNPIRNEPAYYEVFNKLIRFMVDDLKRIGFSDNSSYKKTAEILKLQFNFEFKDISYTKIRERYKYIQKKK